MRYGRSLGALCGAFLVSAPSPGRAQAAEYTARRETPPQEPVANQGAPQQKQNKTTPRVSLAMQNATVAIIADTLVRQAGLRLAYDAEEPALTKRVPHLAIVDLPLLEALANVLNGTGLVATLTPDGRTVTIRSMAKSSNTSSVREVGSIGGTVVDSANGTPIPGVTVSIQGTKLTTTTDAKGAFVLSNVPAGDHAVTFKLLGFISATRTISVADDKRATLRVVMKASATVLSGVVTTATGVKQRVDVGHSVTVLDVDEIRKTAPVTSVTDLLIARVPGMSDLRSTGAPGDPTRLRLRGTNSMLLNNDPIVIIDGVRMYAEQTGNGNLTSMAPTLDGKGGPVPRIGNQDGTMLPTGNVPTTSPLDRLDPNSIQTIEVLNGPSASAIYGSDAANGVIVITTKRGKAGPARWTFDATRGTSRINSSFPMRYMRWGKGISDSLPRHCTIGDYTCTGEDSVILFNAMNNPALSPLGRGAVRAMSTSVSGGTSTIRYSLTGSVHDEDGPLKLPAVTGQQYRQITGRSPESWMRRPQAATRKNASASVTLLPSPSLTIDYSTSLSLSGQSRSALENAPAMISRAYLDSVNGIYQFAGTSGSRTSPSIWLDAQFMPHVHRHTTSDGLTQRHALTGTWNAREWVTLTLITGWDEQRQDDESYLPAGLRSTQFISTDSMGSYQLGRGAISTGTLDGRVMMNVPAFRGIRARPVMGFNYKSQKKATVITSASGLIPGVKSFVDAVYNETASTTEETGTFGVYFEPGLDLWGRIAFSPGIRFDGGSSFGSNAKLFAMPKLNLSWIASNETWLPLPSAVEILRLRAATGQAGVSPQPLDRMRFYQRQQQWLDGTAVDIAALGSYGNTRIRPERSAEWEGGFDVSLYDGRLSFETTIFRKTTRDVLTNVPVAASVYGGAPMPTSQIRINLGQVKNSGTEINATVIPVRTDAVTWTVGGNYTSSRNRLQTVNSTARLLLPSGTAARYVEGYPMLGLWARPMIAYADADGDGVISQREVRIGDSAVFIGPPYPKYEAGIIQTLSFWNGRISVSGVVSYEDGAAQINYAIIQDRWFSQAMNNPAAPLAAQAAAASLSHTDYSAAQVVSTWRLNSLSVSWMLPQSLVRSLRMSMGSVSVQGQNLGLHSNYSGLDPNVNALSTTETSGVADAGNLPAPRMWQFKVSLSR